MMMTPDRKTLDLAIAAIDAERLHDPSDRDTERSYNCAVDDCVKALEQLRDAAPSGKERPKCICGHAIEDHEALKNGARGQCQAPPQWCGCRFVRTASPAPVGGQTPVTLDGDCWRTLRSIVEDERDSSLMQKWSPADVLAIMDSISGPLAPVSGHTLTEPPRVNRNEGSEMTPKKATGSPSYLALWTAVRMILNHPYGCPMCDSGKIRNPEKAHWDSCGFAYALSLIGPSVEPVPEHFAGSR